MIIDAHCHLPVLTDEGTYEQAKRKLLCDLTLDGIDYAILIPDNIAGSPIGDVETCLTLVEGEQRLFLLGTIDVERQGQAWIQKLEDLIAGRRIVGMKIFPGHDPIYPTDPRLWPVYDLCQRFGVPMVIHTGQNPDDPDVAKYNDPAAIIQVADAFPALPIVIAHFFWPEVDYCYRLTQPYQNIYYDTSGMADHEVIEVTGLETIRAVLTQAITEHPKNVVFGTDYAMCKRSNHVDLINGLALPTSVRDRVFWRNAAELFDLGIARGRRDNE